MELNVMQKVTALFLWWKVTFSSFNQFLVPVVEHTLVPGTNFCTGNIHGAFK